MEATVIVYLNNPPFPFGEHTTAIILNGWSVVNAPRPLPGEVTWTGDFRHGVFYAAGPREMFGESWDDLDAWPVQAITNIEIVEMISKRARDRGFKGLCDCLEANGFASIAALARACDLPWRGEPVQ
jgi:hypothetical protein